jgi:hypothetical protein
VACQGCFWSCFSELLFGVRVYVIVSVPAYVCGYVGVECAYVCVMLCVYVYACACLYVFVYVHV